MARVAVAYVEVRPDTTKFATLLKAQLTKVDAKVNVTPDMSGFQTELRSKLAAANRLDAEVRVKPDMDRFRAELYAELKKIKATLKIKIRPDGSELRDLVNRLGRDTERDSGRAGRRAGQSFAKNFGEQMKLGINLRLGQLAPILATVAVAAAPLAQALSAVAAAAVSMAAAAGQAAAALGVSLVSALVAVGQAAGVAAFAFKGLGDALKALDNIQTKVAAGIELTKGDLANYNEAMKKLSPAAREVVGALGKVHGQFATIRKVVQQATFAGLGKEIAKLASGYLPMLQMRMQGTGQVINQAAKSFGAWARQPRVIAQVSDVMAGNNRIAATLSQALVPLASIVLRLVKAFQPLGNLLAMYVSNWAAATDKSTAASASSGKLAATVAKMADALDQAIRIARNMGSALKGTFTAVLPAGRLLMNMFERLTARWASWSNSMSGQSALATWAYQSIPIMSALGRLIGDVAGMFSRLSSGGQAAAFVEQLRQIIPPLEILLHQLSSTGAAASFLAGITSVLAGLAQLGVGGIVADAINMVASLLMGIVGLTTKIPLLSYALTALITVMTTLAAIRFVATLTGLTKLPGMTTAVINFTKALFGMRLAEGVAATTSAKLGAVLRTVGTALKTAFMWTLRQTGALLKYVAVNVIVRAATIAWTAVQWLLNLALDANPIGIIIVVIGALIAAIVVAYNKFAWFRMAVQTYIQVMLIPWRLLWTALKWVGGKLAEFGKWLGELIMKIPGIQAIGNAFKWIGEKIGGVAKWLGKILGITASGEDKVATSTQAASAAQAEQAEAAARAGGAMSRSAKNAIALKKAQDQLAVATRNASNVTAESAQLDDKHIEALARKHKVTTGAISNAWAALANSYIGQEKQRALASAKSNLEILNSNLALWRARAAAAQEDSAAWRHAQDAIAGVETAIANATSDYNRIAADIDRLLVKGATDVGDSIGDSYSGAIDTATNIVKKKVYKTAAGTLTSMKAALSKIDPFTFIKWGKGSKGKKIAFDTGKEIANYLAKGITSGKKNIAKVAAFIQKEFGGKKGKLAQILAKSQKFWTNSKTFAKALPKFKEAMKKAKTGADLDKYLAKQQGTWEDKLAEIKDFKRQAIDTLTQGADLVGHFGFIPTPQEVQKQLQAVRDKMNKFTTDLAALRKGGLSDELAKQWLMAGPDQAGNLVEGLKNATRTELETLSKTYAGTISDATLAADTAATEYFGVGEATVKGYIAGIKSMREEAGKEMARLISSVIVEAKKKLKAHSPSMVFDDMGVDTMDGYIQAVNRMQGDTVATVGKVFDAVTAVPPATLPPPTVGKPGYVPPSGFAAGTTGPPQFLVRVYVGDRELTDIVRTKVERLDAVRARALMTGRRG